MKNSKILSVTLAILIPFSIFIFKYRNVMVFTQLNWYPSNIEKSENIAYSIISAIYYYKKFHGRLPSKLDDLVPDYLSSIPEPTTGDYHYYYHFYKEEFYIKFGFPTGAEKPESANLYPFAVYYSDTGKWKIDD